MGVADRIFINYRRGLNLGEAQHLATLLSQRFGDKRIFIDVRGIDGGDRWLTTLEKQVAAADAMVSLIGSGWLDLKDEDGNRRLDNPTDFVRFEIAQALQRDIPILPVLLEGAPMPRIGQLPQDMMALTQYQAMPLRMMSIVQDAEAIGQRLKVLLAKRRRREVPTWIAALTGGAALSVGAAAGLLSANLFGASPSDVLIRAEKRASEAEQTALKERDGARREVAVVNSQLAAAASAQQERDQAKKDFARRVPELPTFRRDSMNRA
jgi:TIR domain-containing protein